MHTEQPNRALFNASRAIAVCLTGMPDRWLLFLQVLLPLFLESMGNVSEKLPQRLIVMASCPQALQNCKSKHAHCLPWFHRM